jgi:hypothetical protein
MSFLVIFCCLRWSLKDCLSKRANAFHQAFQKVVVRVLHPLSELRRLTQCKVFFSLETQIFIMTVSGLKGIYLELSHLL